MRNFILFILGLVVFASCEKDPIDEIVNEYNPVNVVEETPAATCTPTLDLGESLGIAQEVSVSDFVEVSRDTLSVATDIATTTLVITSQATVTLTDVEAFQLIEVCGEDVTVLTGQSTEVITISETTTSTVVSETVDNPNFVEVVEEAPVSGGSGGGSTPAQDNSSDASPSNDSDVSTPATPVVNPTPAPANPVVETPAVTPSDVVTPTPSEDAPAIVEPSDETESNVVTPVAVVEEVCTPSYYSKSELVSENFSLSAYDYDEIYDNIKVNGLSVGTHNIEFINACDDSVAWTITVVKSITKTELYAESSDDYSYNGKTYDGQNSDLNEDGDKLDLMTKTYYSIEYKKDGVSIETENAGDTVDFTQNVIVVCVDTNPTAAANSWFASVIAEDYAIGTLTKTFTYQVDCEDKTIDATIVTEYVEIQVNESNYGVDFNEDADTVDVVKLRNVKQTLTMGEHGKHNTIEIEEYVSTVTDNDPPVADVNTDDANTDDAPDLDSDDLNEDNGSEDGAGEQCSYTETTTSVSENVPGSKDEGSWSAWSGGEDNTEDQQITQTRTRTVEQYYHVKTTTTTVYTANLEGCEAKEDLVVVSNGSTQVEAWTETQTQVVDNPNYVAPIPELSLGGTSIVAGGAGTFTEILTDDKINTHGQSFTINGATVQFSNNNDYNTTLSVQSLSNGWGISWFVRKQNVEVDADDVPVRWDLELVFTVTKVGEGDLDLTFTQS